MSSFLADHPITGTEENQGWLLATEYVSHHWQHTQTVTRAHAHTHGHVQTDTQLSMQVTYIRLLLLHFGLLPATSLNQGTASCCLAHDKLLTLFFAIVDPFNARHFHCVPSSLLDTDFPVSSRQPPVAASTPVSVT